jgi:hypothetical protein
MSIVITSLSFDTVMISRLKIQVIATRSVTSTSADSPYEAYNPTSGN